MQSMCRMQVISLLAFLPNGAISPDHQHHSSAKLFFY
jgi:hypothetical protein